LFQDIANGYDEIDVKPNLETDIKFDVSISGDGINVSQEAEESNSRGKK
jgi:hypothetical protein